MTHKASTERAARWIASDIPACADLRLVERGGQCAGCARVARRRRWCNGRPSEVSDAAVDASERRGRVEEVLERCGLIPVRGELAGSLPIGVARMVEFARAIVDSPKLLLLDEPASGLDETETQRLGDQIQAVRDETDCLVLVVEHNAGFVMQQSDRVVVLDLGTVLAEGLPAEVQRNQAVRDAYLGEADHSTGASVATPKAKTDTSAQPGNARLAATRRPPSRTPRDSQCTVQESNPIRLWRSFNPPSTHNCLIEFGGGVAGLLVASVGSGGSLLSNCLPLACRVWLSIRVARPAGFRRGVARKRSRSRRTRNQECPPRSLIRSRREDLDGGDDRCRSAQGVAHCGRDRWRRDGARRRCGARAASASRRVVGVGRPVRGRGRGRSSPRVGSAICSPAARRRG